MIVATSFLNLTLTPMKDKLLAYTVPFPFSHRMGCRLDTMGFSMF